MPAIGTFFRWLQEKPEFKERYARAKEEGCDALFEELMEIADDGKNDWMETNDPDNPGYRFNGEHYQRSRLRVDTRKWALSKLKPKRYGERMELEVTNKISEMVDKIGTVVQRYVDADKLPQCISELRGVMDV
jgi:hypothetical protein